LAIPKTTRSRANGSGLPPEQPSDDGPRVTPAGLDVDAGGQFRSKELQLRGEARKAYKDSPYVLTSQIADYKAWLSATSRRAPEERSRPGHKGVADELPTASPVAASGADDLERPIARHSRESWRSAPRSARDAHTTCLKALNRINRRNAAVHGGRNGRSWDRTTTKPNPPAATEAYYSGDLQEERGSAEDDDVPLEPTPFHRALGQPVDKEDEDDAPLGSA
jgi:hypothetical protein